MARLLSIFGFYNFFCYVCFTLFIFFSMDSSDVNSTVAAINSLSKSISDYKASEEAGENYLQAVRENNLNNLMIAREVNAANKEQYQTQIDAAYNLQKRSEWFNSAERQVEDLRNAGINPALAFGDSSTVGSVSLPSAAPAQGAHMEAPTLDAYRDLAARPFSGFISELLENMQGFEKLRSEQIDNNTKDAYNRVQISEMLSRIDTMLSDSKTSSKQRDLLSEQRRSLELANQLFDDTYNDKLDQSALQSKFMKLTNESIDSKMAYDAAQIAIQKYEAETHRRLTDAQVSNLVTLSNLAVSADWRASNMHVMDMNLKQLDSALKSLQIDDKSKQNLFENIMRESELLHTDLKDASLINRICERAFGLGFRDIGTAIRTLITK